MFEVDWRLVAGLAPGRCTRAWSLHSRLVAGLAPGRWIGGWLLGGVRTVRDIYKFQQIPTSFGEDKTFEVLALGRLRC